MKPHQSSMHYLVLGLAASAAMVVAFHWAWNVAMPSLFGLPAIEFQQTVGLIVLLLVSSVVLNLHRSSSRVYGRRHRRDKNEYDS